MALSLRVPLAFLQGKRLWRYRESPTLPSAPAVFKHFSTIRHRFSHRRYLPLSRADASLLDLFPPLPIRQKPCDVSSNQLERPK